VQGNLKLYLTEEEERTLNGEFGEVIAKVPLVDRLEKGPFEIIRTGDLVKVNADKGIVTVIKGI